MKVHSGMLDKMIVIQKRTQTRSASGQPSNVWVNVIATYAHIKPLVGREYLAASEVNNELTHDITMRYRRFVSPGMRVIFAGRYFEIIAVLDPEERREWLFLKCKEAIA